MPCLERSRHRRYEDSWLHLNLPLRQLLQQLQPVPQVPLVPWLLVFHLSTLSLLRQPNLYPSTLVGTVKVDEKPGQVLRRF